MQESTGSIVLSPRSVATGSPVGDALENLNTGVLADGAVCYVISGSGAGQWQLQKTASNTPDGVSIVAPIVGPGRWFLRAPAGLPLLAQSQWGRFVVQNPSPGAQTIPIAAIGGDFTESGDRVQIPGPGLIFVEVTGAFTVSNSGTFNMQTTTLGANTNGQTFNASASDPVPYAQSAFYKSTNVLEEVWLSSNFSPAAPFMANTFMTIVKIPF